MSMQDKFDKQQLYRIVIDKEVSVAINDAMCSDYTHAEFSKYILFLLDNGYLKREREDGGKLYFRETDKSVYDIEE